MVKTIAIVDPASKDACGWERLVGCEVGAPVGASPPPPPKHSMLRPPPSLQEHILTFSAPHTCKHELMSTTQFTCALTGKSDARKKKAREKANISLFEMACNVLHNFNDIEECQMVTACLSSWYEENKRDLPWRRLALKATSDEEQSQAAHRESLAYGVWISEIMCQQTRIATVIEYYNRWMAKWPTVELLASASQEQVNEAWAGLGYYRRASNLLAGAKKIVDLGSFPNSVEGLLQIPGIGRYTAGAIASIAFNKKAPLVDGNVVRVLTRLRAIGADCKQSATMKVIWQLSESLVQHATDPSDFNQGLMELGATLCSKQSPKCAECPLQSFCQAYRLEREYPTKSQGKEVNQDDRDSCTLCLPPTEEEEEAGAKKKQRKITDFASSKPVSSSSPKPARSSSAAVVRTTSFPRKSPKAKPKTLLTVVVIVESKEGGDLLLIKRPSTGLLASMWELPQLDNNDGDGSGVTPGAVMKKFLVFPSSTSEFKFSSLGSVKHQFTHITQFLQVYYHRLEEENVQLRGTERPMQWLPRAQLEGANKRSPATSISTSSSTTLSVALTASFHACVKLLTESEEQATIETKPKSQKK